MLTRTIVVSDNSAIDSPYVVHNATEEQIQQLDDQEVYCIVDTKTLEVFVNGEWTRISEGRIQSNGDLVVVPENAG